ncbi:MAG: L-histidine N(alpha)-methyltransferase [Desulfuromonadales bacterium]|nr:L-histidine N(alpha)-methyltransferase [Desulfuromonadales bacterium]
MKDRIGIYDWPAKQVFLKAFYGVLSNKALVETIVGVWFSINEPDKLKHEVEKCYDSFRRWDKSKPSGDSSRRFLQQIICDNELEVGISQLCSSSIVEFVAFFNDKNDIGVVVRGLLSDKRAKLDSTIADVLSRQYGSALKNDEAVIVEPPVDEYHIRGHMSTCFQGPPTGVEEGRVQSTMFYNLPEAAEAWTDLVDTNNYSMYLDCLLSLKELVASEDWDNALRGGAREYYTAVTLGGGGSPEKDWVLATSMIDALGEQSTLHYWLNDISCYMIHQSAQSLNRRVHQKNLSERITFNYDCSDFLEHDMYFRRPASHHIVWALLGGTIGNVSEKDFFRSLNGPSKVDDLLVVGIDTINGEAPEAFEERMSGEYRCKELDTLLRLPLNGALKDIDPIVEVSITAYKEGGSDNKSDVPNSRTAVFSAPTVATTEKRIVLAHSTRYEVEDLLEFAERLGWLHVKTIPAPSDSSFRQLLLRRFK